MSLTVQATPKPLLHLLMQAVTLVLMSPRLLPKVITQ
ncbi:hypothetical protein MGSAQ_000328 [marine sediment metagenome]|uniref:Uncharacterized protein n=1 Tax=marine sediment metagenome TaxID=412755 RepID=A0A1B6NYW3_9ZZZZ